MKSLFTFIIIVFFLSEPVSGQFRYKDKSYPNNYVDEQGRKQGMWIVYDISGNLINHFEYRNNVPVKTAYFDNEQREILLEKPDLLAHPINYEADQNPLHDREFIKQILKNKCALSASLLIDNNGELKEFRFINGCTKKINKRLLSYFSTVEFEPAKLNGEPIQSQWLFNYDLKLK